MKRLFYFLLVVLMALPAIADAQEMSADPVIEISETDDYITIVVQAAGRLNVKVVRDNNYDQELPRLRRAGNCPAIPSSSSSSCSPTT